MHYDIMVNDDRSMKNLSIALGASSLLTSGCSLYAYAKSNNLDLIAICFVGVLGLSTSILTGVYSQQNIKLIRKQEIEKYLENMDKAAKEKDKEYKK